MLFHDNIFDQLRRMACMFFLFTTPMQPDKIFLLHTKKQPYKIAASYWIKKHNHTTYTNYKADKHDRHGKEHRSLQ